MKKKAGVGNVGAEEAARFEKTVITRATVRAEADAMFDSSKGVRQKDRQLLERLFVQMPGAETSGTNLQKTAAVDAFFDDLEEKQLTVAQKRYPELLKVSMAPGIATRPVPTTTKRVVSPTRGTPPVQSSLSGGAA